MAVTPLSAKRMRTSWFIVTTASAASEVLKIICDRCDCDPAAELIGDAHGSRRIALQEVNAGAHERYVPTSVGTANGKPLDDQAVRKHYPKLPGARRRHVPGRPNRRRPSRTTIDNRGEPK
jgi:hypothetical protein